jgi:hypothetical protein
VATATPPAAAAAAAPSESVPSTRLPDTTLAYSGSSNVGLAAAGQQQFYSSAASDVSASMSTSTWPGSTAAVAGTPCGSVVGAQDASSTTSFGGRWVCAIC